MSGEICRIGVSGLRAVLVPKCGSGRMLMISRVLEPSRGCEHLSSSVSTGPLIALVRSPVERFLALYFSALGCRRQIPSSGPLAALIDLPDGSSMEPSHHAKACLSLLDRLSDDLPSRVAGPPQQWSAQVDWLMRHAGDDLLVSTVRNLPAKIMAWLPVDEAARLAEARLDFAPPPVWPSLDLAAPEIEERVNTLYSWDLALWKLLAKEEAKARETDPRQAFRRYADL